MGLTYVKRLDVPNGSILERIKTAFRKELLGENRLGKCSERNGGSDTSVFASTLLGKSGVTPVVLKFWRNDGGHTPHQILTIHNNYQTLRAMQEKNMFGKLIVPRAYYSFMEVGGLLIALPVNRRIAMSSVHDIGEVTNQLLIVDDLTAGGKYPILDNVNENNIPSELSRDIAHDLSCIEKRMPSGVLGSSPGFLLSALLIVKSDPPKVAIADIDKLALIFYPENLPAGMPYSLIS